MRNLLTVILSAGLLTLPALAKIPEQGALFSLTRFVDGKEHKLADNEKLGAGTLLRLHVLAIHQSCTIVATPFQKGKARSVGSLQPSLARLVPDEETTLDFRLTAPVKGAELFVVVVPQQSPTSDELTQLVVDWKNKPEESQGPRNAIHDRLSDWLTRRDKSLTYAGPVPQELGGVRTTSAQSNNPTTPNTSTIEVGGGNQAKGRPRQVFTPPYLWRQQANWLPCSSAQPGVYVYPLGK